MKKPIFVLGLALLMAWIYTAKGGALEEAAPSAPATSPSPSEEAGDSCGSPSCQKPKNLPQFKVVFHNNLGQTHLLIPKKTSVRQIERFVKYLAEERKNNGLEKIGIPPTGSGDYLRGSILIFKEIRWARGEKLTNPRIKEKTYSRHIIAEYIWNNHSETAYMGPKTLFSNSLTPP